MITFGADIRRAVATTSDDITVSSVGIPVKLNLAREFLGLAKTVIFKAGTAKVDVVLVGDAAETACPPDVLTAAGVMLSMGVYAADPGGNVVIPTVWADVDIIKDGSVPSGVDPSAPTPSWVAQVQEVASDALEKAEAVEAAAEQGEFNGEDGYSPTVEVEDITGGHRVTITDVNGPHVFDVMDGEGGGGSAVSPTVTITDITGGHRVTITDIDHPSGQSFDVMDGKDGKDGEDGKDGADGADGQDGVSPSVTISSITGGHRITITDAAHPNGQTVDVMDGQDGQDGQNGAPGQDGQDGAPGQDGADGTTFTPAVSAAGVLSWTNDGNKQNPQSVDLVAAVLSALPVWTGGSY